MARARGAVYVVGRGRLGTRFFLGWTAFGVIDLLSAVGVLFSDGQIGLLSGGTDLTEELPMVLISAFGVPVDPRPASDLVAQHHRNPLRA